MSMKTIVLNRVAGSSRGTFGVMALGGIPICVTCELPWNDNLQGKSCIPEGNYLVTLSKSPTKNKQVGYRVFRVNDVKGRDQILIHIANWPHELLGCIGVGAGFALLNGKPAITNSTSTMKKLLAELPDSFRLEIRNSHET